jgi:hypothetical protein
VNEPPPADDKTPSPPTQHVPGHKEQPQPPELPPSNPAPPTFVVELKEHRSKDRAALAGVVMTGAVGIAAAFTSLWTSTAHDKQETIRAQASFMQSQRKEAYAAFDGAIDAFREAVWAEERLYRPENAPDNPLAPEKKENLGASVNNVVFAESKITFYGSDETHKMADEVVRQMWTIRNQLAEYVDVHPNYRLSGADAGDFIKVAHEIRGLVCDKLWDAQASFRDAARRDLGLQPLPHDSADPSCGVFPGVPAAAAAPAPVPR